jgi:hypothetical protein
MADADCGVDIKRECIHPFSLLQPIKNPKSKGKKPS